MSALFENMFFAGLVPTVLIVAFVPQLIWFFYLMFKRSALGISKGVLVSFSLTFFVCFAMSFFVLLVYAITRSGI